MAKIADVTGRYLYMTVEGVEYRVYFEEAGSGVPLLCQHTAGCDGRQWRHLLEDPDFTSRFRVVAADLPFHGRSLPPVGPAWWASDYSLKQSFFMGFLVELSHQLELDRPIYVGCSMGGHLAPDLAINHPDEFRAVVGVEAAINSHGADTLMQWYFHPRIANTFKAEQMFGICAPQSPEPLRRETAFMYSQGAPPTFKGDLDYYLVEHDVTDTAKEIDTSRVEVHILNGEYDYSAAPVDGQELADQIDGATFTEMKEVGHFPMSENPEAFKRYLMPVLDQVVGAAVSG